MSEAVRLEMHAGVALLTLDRPEAMNTLTLGMIDELGAAYQRCDQDDAIKAVVVTGRGAAFCAGADLSQGDAFSEELAPEFSTCPLSMQAYEVRKPVIMAVNGHAVGVGLSLAMHGDLRLVADEGRYGFLQNRRGVVVDFGMGQMLPRLVGMERAFELLVAARRYRGQELVELGLARRSLPADQVLPVAMEMAAEMAQHCSPLIMGIHKRLLWEGLQRNQQDYLALETAALRYSMGRSDAIEGGMAFFEKREPRWQSSVTGDWPDFL